MSDWKIIKKIKLSPNQSSNSKLKMNYVGEDVTQQIVELKLCEYKQGKSYYIFYYNSGGQERGDTYHESLKEAFKQAESSYGVKPEDWEDTDEDYKS